MKLFSRKRGGKGNVLKGKEDDQGTHRVTAAAAATTVPPQQGRAHTWPAAGLDPWLSDACAAMGLKTPSEVQGAVIPPILAGRDVIACSQTGTGKTAAFALPIIQKLSEDPYGIFAVVLTPGRELAHQIGEQFTTLGAPMGVRVEVVTGGKDMTLQSLHLDKLPHIVVATPGRLAALIKGGATCPRLSSVAFVVLDEADRLLDPTIAPDLFVILDALPAADTGRQTLLFSATISKNVKRIESLALRDPFKFEATPEPTTVSKLKQEYVLVPKAVKACYLTHILDKIGPVTGIVDDEEEALNRELGRRKSGVVKRVNKRRTKRGGGAGAGAGGGAGGGGDADDDDEDVRHADAAIVFVGTLYTCQFLVEVLSEMGVLCVGLHSALDMRRRIANLGKFKASVVPVLVATDVASRGLDIPKVELVVNYDVPQVAADYIHRVGRTARAGRGGRAVTFITQHDVTLVQSIEAKIGVKMVAMPEVVEEEALKRLKELSTAQRMARMRLTDTGFEDTLEELKNRKKASRARIKDWVEAEGGGGEAAPDAGHGGAGAVAEVVVADKDHTTRTPPSALKKKRKDKSMSATPAKSSKKRRKKDGTSASGGRGGTASERKPKKDRRKSSTGGAKL